MAPNRRQRRHREYTSLPLSLPLTLFFCLLALFSAFPALLQVPPRVSLYPAPLYPLMSRQLILRSIFTNRALRSHCTAGFFSGTSISVISDDAQLIVSASGSDGILRLTRESEGFCEDVLFVQEEHLCRRPLPWIRSDLHTPILCSTN